MILVLGKARSCSVPNLVWVKSLATTARCCFCSGSRSHGMNFAMTCFMTGSWVKISNTVVFGIPGSASSSGDSLIAARTRSTFSDILLIAGLPEHGSLSIDSQPSLKCLCHTFIYAALIASSVKAFGIIWIVSVEECSSLMQNLMQICCSTCSVIFECDNHTVHILTQRHLPPPLTSTVQSSLFKSTLLGWFYQSPANCSPYINHGWTFSRQTSYILSIISIYWN